jgi:hypothetical protein
VQLVIRKDHTGSGGGVRILAERQLSIVRVELYDKFPELHVEVICIYLFYRKSKLRFFVIYRPPKADHCAVKSLNL